MPKNKNLLHKITPSLTEIVAQKQKKMNSERILAHIFVKPAFRPSLALIAEGKKQSMILQAEAEKESAIQKAKGEAEAILEVQQAKPRA